MERPRAPASCSSVPGSPTSSSAAYPWTKCGAGSPHASPTSTPHANSASPQRGARLSRSTLGTWTAPSAPACKRLGSTGETPPIPTSSRRPMPPAKRSPRSSRCSYRAPDPSAAALPALELLAQLHPAPVDPALRGGERDLEHARDLLVRESLDVTEDDGGAGVDRERA